MIPPPKRTQEDIDREIAESRKSFYYEKPKEETKKYDFERSSELDQLLKRKQKVASVEVDISKVETSPAMPPSLPVAPPRHKSTATAAATPVVPAAPPKRKTTPTPTPVIPSAPKRSAARAAAKEEEKSDEDFMSRLLHSRANPRASQPKEEKGVPVTLPAPIQGMRPVVVGPIIGEPKPVVVKREPEPVKKPVVVEESKPVVVEESKPVEEPVVEPVEESKPEPVEEPKPEPVEEPKPVEEPVVELKPEPEPEPEPVEEAKPEPEPEPEPQAQAQAITELGVHPLHSTHQ